MWFKLSESEIKEFGLSTYTGEIILINEKGGFYFNAQEFFSEEELDSFTFFGFFGGE